jgi:hypothetical protein
MSTKKDLSREDYFIGQALAALIPIYEAKYEEYEGSLLALVATSKFDWSELGVDLEGYVDVALGLSDQYRAANGGEA